MESKKQFYNQLEQTIRWNTIRGNTPDTYSKDLEVSMLQEELNEYKEATDLSNTVKELLDILFVTYGTLSKLGLPSTAIVECYGTVIQSNNQKSKTKNAAGKITKSVNFVKAEPQIAKILKKYFL